MAMTAQTPSFVLGSASRESAFKKKNSNILKRGVLPGVKDAGHAHNMSTDLVDVYSLPMKNLKMGADMSPT